MQILKKMNSLDLIQSLMSIWSLPLLMQLLLLLYLF